MTRAHEGADDAALPVALLDAERAHRQPLSADLVEQRAAAADASLPLEERLEAFEDVFDSEVGDTSLVRARNVERDAGLRQLYLKFDGGNPTGTQKDRIAFAQVADALRRGFDVVTVATCGNYGAAIALAASVAGLRCEVCVPESFRTRRVEEMEAIGAAIVRTPGDYEAAVAYSQQEAERRELYDANPGGANTAIQLAAYGEIANEIYDDLRDAPVAVGVPVSNGTTLAGIHKGFVRLYRRGKTSRIPRMVAGSSTRKNPIVRSFLRGLDRCEDLDPATLHETSVNEPLINWHSFDGDLALQAIRDSGGFAANVSDRNMLRHAKLLLDREGINALPASCAALAVMLERHATEPLPPDRYVVVLTGRR
ncbi:MAG: pyridoxal-phosphate dependent enzyme [Thermoanaerobaculia bacterium]|nr:pyridoxal-phosphate dependent enzyme [Thermoanaerobaculia bacterium]